MQNQFFYWNPLKYTLAKASLKAWQDGNCSRMTPKTLACVVEHLLVQSWQIRKDEARRQALESSGKTWTPEEYSSPQAAFEQNTPKLIDTKTVSDVGGNAAIVALAAQHIAFRLSGTWIARNKGIPESACTLPNQETTDEAAFAIAPAIVRLVAVGVVGFFVDSVAQNIVEGVVEVQRFETAAAADNEKWIAYAQMQQKKTGQVPEPPSAIRQLAEAEFNRIAKAQETTPLGNVSSIVKWAVVGAGIWGAYKLLAPKKRSNPSRYRKRLNPPRKKTAAKKKKATKRNPRKKTAAKKTNPNRRVKVKTDYDKLLNAWAVFAFIPASGRSPDRWAAVTDYIFSREAAKREAKKIRQQLGSGMPLVEIQREYSSGSVKRNPRKKAAAKKKTATKRKPRKKAAAKKKTATKRNPRKTAAKKNSTEGLSPIRKAQQMMDYGLEPYDFGMRGGWSSLTTRQINKAYKEFQASRITATKRNPRKKAAAKKKTATKRNPRKKTAAKKKTATKRNPRKKTAAKKKTATKRKPRKKTAAKKKTATKRNPKKKATRRRKASPKKRAAA